MHSLCLARPQGGQVSGSGLTILHRHCGSAFPGARQVPPVDPTGPGIFNCLMYECWGAGRQGGSIPRCARLSLLHLPFEESWSSSEIHLCRCPETPRLSPPGRAGIPEDSKGSRDVSPLVSTHACGRRVQQFVIACPELSQHFWGCLLPFYIGCRFQQDLPLKENLRGCSRFSMVGEWLQMYQEKPERGAASGKPSSP